MYAGLSFIALRMKLAVTPAWTNGTLERNQARLVAFDYTNNEQSRVLQWAIPEALTRLFGLTRLLC